MSNHQTLDAGDDTHGLGDGARAALPLVLPTAVGGVSFGVAADALGWPWVAAVVMSIVVFSGSAQFGSTAVLAAGGSVGAAIAAAAFANLRFLPLGVLAAPATRGGKVRRAFEGQLVVDASVLLAMHQGRVSRGLLIGATLIQGAGWVGGTAIGAIAGLGTDADKLGIDAVFPAFFLYLLAEELRETPDRRSALRVALGGAGLALALTPLVPPGVPVVAAVLAALLAMGRR